MAAEERPVAADLTAGRDGHAGARGGDCLRGSVNPGGYEGGTHPVPGGKAVAVSTLRGGIVDGRVVSRRFYNRMNVRNLVRLADGKPLMAGITSVNPREGKTLVACNLAASLSIVCGAPTVLMDCNPGNPRIHEVFDVPLHPGLLNALEDDTIHLTPSRVERLSILPAGLDGAPRIGLEDLDSLAGVLRSLRSSFQFVIADLPALTSEDLNDSLIGVVGGVIVVIDTQRTTRREIEKSFRRIPHDLILGLIFNRVHDDD